MLVSFTKSKAITTDITNIPTLNLHCCVKHPTCKFDSHIHYSAMCCILFKPNKS